MRLESLQIHGFKSFADKVELVFKPGITAIVGPNGCGKSNITDAIRWVLGEQSAKSLRGGQMEDVIFNGSSCRKPQGMAEVSLKVANLGSLSVPFQEVVITRRIFRSGETEYLINKTLCRLKDIVELFLDTGVGRGAYSIVEQGKVDFVITAKPKERRSLIESAAGILKYKARKEEALKKIEATNQNLERLEDILHEVEKQKDTLSKQAERASLYQEYASREKELLKNIATAQYLLFQKKQKELEKKYEQLKDNQISANTEIIRYEAELEGLRAGLLEDEEKISFLQKNIYSLENQINSLSQQQQTYHKESTRLEEEKTNIALELEELHNDLDRIDKVSLDTEKALLERAELLLAQEKSLISLEADYSNLQKGIQEKKRLYEIHRKDILGLSNQQTRLEQLNESLKEKQKELKGREEGLEKVLQRLEQDLQKKTEEKKNLQNKLEVNKKLLEEGKNQQEALLERIENISEELQDIETRVRTWDKELHSVKSRLRSLEEIFERKEGYQDSVKHLLLNKDKDSVEPSGLLGVIAELMNVPSEYEKAIEALLEHALQYLVVTSLADSLKLLEYLKNQNMGRATFLSLADCRIANPYDKVEAASSRLNKRQDGASTIFSDRLPEDIFSAGTGIQPVGKTFPDSYIIGPALDFIKFPDKYSGVMEYLFDRAIIVENLTAAREIVTKWPGHYKLVTLHGEVLTSYGLVSGGGSHRTSPGFLAQKRQIEELKTSIPHLEDQMAQEETRRKGVVAQLEECRREKENLSKKDHQLEISGNGLLKDLSHLEREIDRDGRQLEDITYKKERYRADEEELAKDLKNQQERLDKIKEERKETEGRVETSFHDIENLSTQEKEFQNKVMKAKIDLTSLQEHQKALRLDLARHKEDRILNLKKQGNLQQRLEKIGVEVNKNEQGLVELKNKIPALEEERIISSAELKKMETRRYEEIEMVKGIEKKLKKAQQEHTQINLKMKEVELRLAEVQTHLNHILEDSNISISAIEAGKDGSQETTETMINDQIEDWQNQLQKVKEKIISLGPVNLMAIEEYNQLLERYQFLDNQRKDMINSLSSLNSLIEKINFDSRERFKKTFDIISENFQAVFKRLFEGGHAELLLDQPDDLLETGIEVVVQPPGKKPQYLSLLSGGEKALTAIAFIFAVYLLKPSPFCLLDEIDAPLDDANINRLINLLNEFKQRTQFLVITHSKKTMQMANIIYGVTMEQPGLSKIISLELKKGEI